MTDPELQEALSHKYASNAAVLVPLSTGRWALFNRAYEFQAMVEPTEVLGAIRFKYSPPKIVPKAVALPAPIDDILGDL